MIELLFDKALSYEEGNILLPCKSCEMYCQMDSKQVDFLKKRHTKNNIRIPCTSCQQKRSLLNQIEDLNNTIQNLNERISSLIHIRNSEKEMDSTLEHLAQNFDQLHLNNTTSTVPPAICEEVVEFADNNSINNNLTIKDNDKYTLPNNSTSTSVWDESFDSTNSIPSMNFVSETITSNFSELSNASSISNAHSDVISISDNGDCTDSVNGTIDSTITIKNNESGQTRKVSKLHPEKLSHNLNAVVNEKIKVILAGDKSLKNVKIASSHFNQQNCLKIAPENENIQHLYDSVNFFIGKLNGNVNHVIIQLGYRDCTQGKTELIKKAVSDLSNELFSQNITLIISSPIPYPSLTNHAFSRAYSINNWLIDFCVENDITLIDNFYSLAKDKELFTHSGYELNPTGSQMIGKVISETLSTLYRR